MTTDRFGVANKAYYFDGNSNITVNDAASLHFGTGDFSISVWVNAQSYTSLGSTILTKSFQSLHNWSLYLSSINPFVIRWCNQGISDQATTCQLTANIWQYVAINRHGDTMSFYLNGTKCGSNYVPNANYSAQDTLRIGSEGDPTLINKSYFKGSLDDIRLYNRVLSTNEILAIYNEGCVLPINKSGFTGSPASFSVDSIFNSVTATFNTSTFSSIDTLYMCYETANLTYLTQRPDKPANYTVNVGGAVADFGNNISTGTFSTKIVNITALKALSANFQITFNYTGGGGEVIFANPYLLVYGSPSSSAALPKAIVRPQSLMKASAFPNPVRTSATINYSVPSSTTLDISIYSSDGKLVKNVFSGLRQVGSFNYMWNGTNLSGSAVANGNYFFRVKAANGQQISEQIVVLK